MVSHMMAAESDGVVNLTEEQPIDLSKVTKKPMPPLIPISLLRSDYQSFCQDRKKPPQRTFSHPENQDRNRREEWREKKRDDEEDNDTGTPARTRKRVRHEIEVGGWAHCKLDRARSVPQLTPLSTLQRNKSMSESRITEATTNVPGNYKSDEQFQLGSGMISQRHAEYGHGYGGAMQPSWVYIGYYSQLLHRFQAQEMLRQFALHQEREGPLDEQNGSAERQMHASMTDDTKDQSEEAAELRRRQSRPLTGKHVRPGTGASPSTLLSLRRKIQARRQQQDDPNTNNSTQIGETN